MKHFFWLCECRLCRNWLDGSVVLPTEGCKLILLPVLVFSTVTIWNKPCLVATFYVLPHIVQRYRFTPNHWSEGNCLHLLLANMNICCSVNDFSSCILPVTTFSYSASNSGQWPNSKVELPLCKCVCWVRRTGFEGKLGGVFKWGNFEIMFGIKGNKGILLRPYFCCTYVNTQKM